MFRSTTIDNDTKTSLWGRRLCAGTETCLLESPAFRTGSDNRLAPAPTTLQRSQKDQTKFCYQNLLPSLRCSCGLAVAYQRDPRPSIRKCHSAVLSPPSNVLIADALARYSLVHSHRLPEQQAPADCQAPAVQYFTCPQQPATTPQHPQPAVQTHVESQYCHHVDLCCPAVPPSPM
jgi:hypothetical protein